MKTPVSAARLDEIEDEITSLRRANKKLAEEFADLSSKIDRRLKEIAEKADDNRDDDDDDDEEEPEEQIEKVKKWASVLGEQFGAPPSAIVNHLRGELEARGGVGALLDRWWPKKS